METVVGRNNGVERQNKNFKDEYLKKFRDGTLSGSMLIVLVLIEQFLPDKYKK